MASHNRSIRGPLEVSRALREFVATELAGGIALLVATVVALVWANSPWSDGYRSLWETELGVRLGERSLSLDLRHWVTEGLMAIFFVVVGLEVKRELVEGELRDPRHAALPVIAAFGGMIVPALLYLTFNVGDQGHSGWGIPMATDIAFALGVTALVGRGLPPSLRLFLLTLAIVDDIAAIVVIALFYSDGVAWWWLAVAAGIFAAAFVIREAGVVFSPLFVAFGIGIWLALHEAGVHATLAGVAMGLLAPTQPRLSREIIVSRSDQLLDVFTPKTARETSRLARLSVSQTEWLEHALHPWSSLVVVPVFALANAGVPLSADALEGAASSAVTWGVVIGLVVGKVAGISAFSWLACRTRVATLPTGVHWRELVGVAALAGIGFTVSLFVTGLAFDRVALQDEAKVGILAASAAATVVGSAVLLAGRRTVKRQA